MALYVSSHSNVYKQLVQIIGEVLSEVGKEQEY